MMRTQLAAVIVVKVGSHRQLAQPLSAVQQSYLSALGVPATYLTVPPSGEGEEEGRRKCQRHHDGNRQG
jgi:hypothetical protein